MNITIPAMIFLSEGFELKIQQKLFLQPSKRVQQKGYEIISLPDSDGFFAVTNWNYKHKPNIKDFYIPVEVKIINSL